MKFPKENYYTEDHEWIFVNDEGIGTVGITDYAQDKLGDIVFVELPEINKVVEKGDPLAVVESTKNASDIFSPVSGKVIELNELLEENPEKINSDPYGEGWICKIELKDRNELNELMKSDEYLKFIDELEEEEE